MDYHTCRGFSSNSNCYNTASTKKKTIAAGKWFFPSFYLANVNHFVSCEWERERSNIVTVIKYLYISSAKNKRIFFCFLYIRDIYKRRDFLNLH